MAHCMCTKTILISRAQLVAWHSVGVLEPEMSSAMVSDGIRRQMRDFLRRTHTDILGFKNKDTRKAEKMHSICCDFHIMSDYSA